MPDPSAAGVPGGDGASEAAATFWETVLVLLGRSADDIDDDDDGGGDSEISKGGFGRGSATKKYFLPIGICLTLPLLVVFGTLPRGGYLSAGGADAPTDRDGARRFGGASEGGSGVRPLLAAASEDRRRSGAEAPSDVGVGADLFDLASAAPTPEEAGSEPASDGAGFLDASEEKSGEKRFDDAFGTGADISEGAESVSGASSGANKSASDAAFSDPSPSEAADRSARPEVPLGAISQGRDSKTVSGEINPPYLRFDVPVRIRYRSSSPSAAPPADRWWAALHVAPRDGLRGFAARRALEVRCPERPGRTAPSDSAARDAPRECRSRAAFWIRRESLLEGDGAEAPRRSSGFVRRSVRVELLRERSGSEGDASESGRVVVDFWGGVVKVPVAHVHSGRFKYETSYTADLRGEIFVAEPASHFEREQAWNATDKTAEEEHGQSQGSRDQGTVSTLEKLLCGCLSGMAIGLWCVLSLVPGALALVKTNIGRGFVASVGSPVMHRDAEDSSVGADASCARVDVAVDSTTRVVESLTSHTVQDGISHSTGDQTHDPEAIESPSNYQQNRSLFDFESDFNGGGSRRGRTDTAGDTEYDKDPSSESPYSHQQNRSLFDFESDFDGGDSTVDTEYGNGSSLVQQMYPRKRQGSDKKKIYARRFGTELQNSKTPRRSNLRSSRQSNASVDTLENNVDRDSHDADANRASEEEAALAESAIVYSPRFENDATVPLPHSNTFSSESETAELGEQDEVVVENEAVFYSPKFDDDATAPLPHSNTFSSQEETEELGEEDAEMTVNDGSDASASDVSFVHRQTSTTTPSEQSETEPSQSGHEDRDADSTADENGTVDQSNEPKERTSAMVDGANQTTKDNMENSTEKHEASNTMDSIVDVGSRVLSDADPSFDGHRDAADFEFEAMPTYEQDKSPPAKCNDVLTKDLESPSIPQTSNAQSPAQSKSPTALERSSPPRAPAFQSPRRKLRPRNALGSRQDKEVEQNGSPTSTVAATAADFVGSRRKFNIPFTSDRPLPVRCGAAGQSKKLAVSSRLDATDELSFKSGNTVDCGGERVGQRVAKDLNGATIFGTITEYDGKDSPEIWRVEYDDGRTGRDYYHREDLLEALMHYRIHEREDPNNNYTDDIHGAEGPSFDEQSERASEESDDQSTKKAREKKRARNERRLRRTAKRPAIHRASAALIPLSQDMDRPVWQFS